MYGSVRGARGNSRPYRDVQPFVAAQLDQPQRGPLWVKSTHCRTATAMADVHQKQRTLFAINTNVFAQQRDCACSCCGRRCTLAALPGLQLLERRIVALLERETDSFQDDIMDFAALLEGNCAQRLIDALRQIKA
jgi:hypothetical protein